MQDGRKKVVLKAWAEPVVEDKEDRKFLVKLKVVKNAPKAWRSSALEAEGLDETNLRKAIATLEEVTEQRQLSTQEREDRKNHQEKLIEMHQTIAHQQQVQKDI
ncbi:hypothetical protein L2E82_18179 [Cichorium intybus]|uniref:Uncharacterized protein n=1 Tax=Cichorium intybus TaxID=13427 RepID=A0ACB9FAB5_CICIN|nr:hypothetical protein L2E82_18179 [Cichorium intybus]